MRVYCWKNKGWKWRWKIFGTLTQRLFAKIKEVEEALEKVKQDYSSQGKDSPLLGQYDFASLIANLENQLVILRGTTPIEGIQ